MDDVGCEKWAGQQAGGLANIMREYRAHLRQQEVGRQEQQEIRATRYSFSDVVLTTDVVKKCQQDPVRFALCAEAREIGWQAYAKGGIELMRLVADYLDDKAVDSFPGAILDKWWDGIGSNDDGRWCA